ncbi:MAG: dockerin type I repeat-containing protein [Clostridia bacterium]|nr:dockerin type I repeat-containing protein [Clostridia bacterium]
MKKLIAILTVIVMTVVMCVGAFAQVNLDRLYINADQLDDANIVSHVGKSPLVITPGDKIYILGWAAKTGTNLEKIYYKVNGEAKECDGSNSYTARADVAPHIGVDAAYLQNSAIGANNAMMELIGIDELAEGTYDIKIIALYQDSTEEVGYSFTLRVATEITDQDYTIASGNNTPSQNAIWLTKDGQSVEVEFKTKIAFNSISVPTTWASTEADGRPATVVLNLYAYDTDIDTTLENDPIQTFTYDTVRDGFPACTLEFDQKVPAGTYIFQVMTVGEKMTGNTAQGSAYLVLDGAAQYDTTKVHYTSLTFCLAINGDITDGEFLDKAPDVEEGVIGGEVSYRNASFDSFYVDGVLNFGKGDGKASDKLDEEDRTVGDGTDSVNKLTLRGWIGFNGAEIEAFGYKIGNADPVYSTSFVVNAEPAVIAAGGPFAKRFQVEVPVKGIEGNKEIVMMVKLSNGDEYAIDEELEAEGPATAPNTRFTYVGIPVDVMLGDIDGDGEISDWDAIVFERYLAGWDVEVNEDAMDLDDDGEVSDWDAIMLARYLAGWDVSFG